MKHFAIQHEQKEQGLHNEFLDTKKNDNNEERKLFPANDKRFHYFFFYEELMFCQKILEQFCKKNEKAYRDMFEMLSKNLEQSKFYYEKICKVKIEKFMKSVNKKSNNITSLPIDRIYFQQGLIPYIKLSYKKF